MNVKSGPGLVMPHGSITISCSASAIFSAPQVAKGKMKKMPMPLVPQYSWDLNFKHEITIEREDDSSWGLGLVDRAAQRALEVQYIEDYGWADERNKALQSAGKDHDLLQPGTRIYRINGVGPLRQPQIMAEPRVQQPAPARVGSAKLRTPPYCDAIVGVK